MIDTSSLQRPHHEPQLPQPLKPVIKSKSSYFSPALLVSLGLPSQSSNQQALFDGLWFTLSEHINHLFSDQKKEAVFYQETSYRVRMEIFKGIECYEVVQNGPRSLTSGEVGFFT